jgi:excisionase family DNA binding protein
MPNNTAARLPRPKTPTELEPLYTKAEAAELLNVPLRFVERIISEHRIRFVRVGRHIRIPESAIAEFVGRATAHPR